MGIIYVEIATVCTEADILLRLQQRQDHTRGLLWHPGYCSSWIYPQRTHHQQGALPWHHAMSTWVESLYCGPINCECCCMTTHHHTGHSLFAISSSKQELLSSPTHHTQLISPPATSTCFLSCHVDFRAIDFQAQKKWKMHRWLHWRTLQEWVPEVFWQTLHPQAKVCCCKKVLFWWSMCLNFVTLTIYRPSSRTSGSYHVEEMALSAVKNLKGTESGHFQGYKQQHRHVIKCIQLCATLFWNLNMLVYVTLHNS